MKVGDYGSGITITIKDQAGVVVNLTGKTVTMKVKLGERTFKETMTVTTPASGQASYVWQEGDINTDGTMEIEVKVTGTNYNLRSDILEKDVEPIL